MSIEVNLGILSGALNNDDVVLYCLVAKKVIGQRREKLDLRTYAKSVDSDQPPCLRRRVWSESALFDTRHINSTYISCFVSNWITYCIRVDLGLHYVKCPKVPFRVTLAN